MVTHLLISKTSSQVKLRLLLEIKTGSRQLETNFYRKKTILMTFRKANSIMKTAMLKLLKNQTKNQTKIKERGTDEAI